MSTYPGTDPDSLRRLREEEQLYAKIANSVGTIVNNYEKYTTLLENSIQIASKTAQDWETAKGAVNTRMDEASSNLKTAYTQHIASGLTETQDAGLHEAKIQFQNTKVNELQLGLKSGEKTTSELVDIHQILTEIIDAYNSGDAEARTNLTDEDMVEIKLTVAAVEKVLRSEAKPLDTSSNKPDGTTESGLSKILKALEGEGTSENGIGGVSKLISKAGVWASAINTTLTAISRAASAILNKVGEEVNAATALLEQQSTKQLDSRLYGLLNEQKDANVNFLELATDAVELVGSSPLLKSQDLINNIVTLGNQGIAYNLEQRALWETLSDKIVSTFDVTNGYLLQLIKLQQSELTDTYMGIEAAITRTLNSMYQDTQYLNSTYDSVLNTLTNTLSTVGTDLGTQIAYQVELWLGSLSSLGLSDSAANSIATALNALLSGDVKSLSDSGKKLLAMAASNAEISFADLLVEGVEDGKTLNTLMASMVEVLQQIYESSEDNNAVLSQWGDVFGLELADWKAISNLTETYLTTLTSDSIANFNQQSAMDETAYIMNNLIAERTTTNERITNLVDNTLFGMGFDIATDEQEFIAWKTAEAGKKLANMLFGSDSKITAAINALGSIAQGITLLGNLSDTIEDIAAALPDLLSADATVTQFLTDSSGQAGIEVIAQLFRLNADGNNYVDTTNEALKIGSYSEQKGLAGFSKSVMDISEYGEYAGIDYTEMDSTEAIRTGQAIGMSTRAAGASKYNPDYEYAYFKTVQELRAAGYEETDGKLHGAQGFKGRRLKETAATAEDVSGSENVAEAAETVSPTEYTESENAYAAEEATTEATTGSATTTVQSNGASTTAATTTGTSALYGRTGEEQNYNQSMTYYNSTSSTSYTNASDEEYNGTTYDITDLYLLVTTGQGANVRLIGVDPSVEFKSTVSGNLAIDSGSIDGHIRSVVSQIVS